MFFTTHLSVRAHLSGLVLPRAVDAALTSRSGFARRAVGGAFFVVASVHAFIMAAWLGYGKPNNIARLANSQ